MSTDAEIVAELRRLLERATHAPWGQTRDGHGFCVVNPDGTPATGGLRVGMYPYVGRGNRPDDVDLIVAIRNALPTLLRLADEAIALRKVRDAAAAYVASDVDFGRKEYVALCAALDEAKARS